MNDRRRSESAAVYFSPFHFFFAGRRSGDNRQPSAGGYQDLGVDWGQAGDRHQHRLLLPTAHG